MNWRPDNWPKDPCENCEHKKEDDWGLICDLTCGLASAHCYREEGANLILEALKSEGNYGTWHQTQDGDWQEVSYDYVGEPKGWMVLIEDSDSGLYNAPGSVRNTLK